MGAIMTSRQAAELDHALERNGLSAEDVKKMSEEDFLAQVLAVLRGEAKIERNKLLKFISTITLPATTALFIASENFVVSTGNGAKVKISYVSDIFKKQFFGKKEKKRGKINLRYGDLTRSSKDDGTISELGGKKKAETLLQDVYALLAQQPKGEEGSLLTDGKANIFYVLNNAGLLFAVGAYWGGGGWNLYAYSVVNPSACYVGFRVFSRD